MPAHDSSPKRVSELAKRLDSDPELKSRYHAAIRELREAVKDDIEAAESSEHITSADLSVVINARTDSVCSE